MGARAQRRGRRIAMTTAELDEFLASERTSFPHDGRHAWLRVVPAQITSWDFRKSQQAAATATALTDAAAGSEASAGAVDG